jgi:hypothetical protein
MNNEIFLHKLNSINFSERYWALCERYPLVWSDNYGKGTKKDVLIALEEAGAKVVYHSVDRSYEIEPELIADYLWSGLFVKQKSGGLELVVSGKRESERVGSNFAVLAYDAKQASDPNFERSSFGGPPPYPRPFYNGDPVLLKSIAKEFVFLYREIKIALK